MPQKTMDDVIRANTERQRYSIAVLDIETTGLDKKLDYILEIGICELNLLTGIAKSFLIKSCERVDSRKNIGMLGFLIIPL